MATPCLRTFSWSTCTNCCGTLGKNVVLNVPPCTILQGELKSSGGANSRDCRRREAENGSLRKLAELLVQVRFDFLILFRPGFTVAPGLQRDEIESAVTGPDIA